MDTTDLSEHQDYRRFWAYHTAHPETYQFFVEMARRAKARGYSRCAIRHLIEIGRWEKGRDFSLASGFSHDFQPLYVRLIMAQEPDLDGLFETRKLAAQRQAA